MKETLFHHPDISFPVLRRRASEVFLDMLNAYGELTLKKGHSLMWSSCFPSETAYKTARSRLSKSGVIAYRQTGSNRQILLVPEEVPAKRRDLFHPEKFWRRKWSGTWSILVYDVPEEDRTFREGLRRFLRMLRMGCLQKSVWVSPWDIRPSYDDLVQTVGVQFVAHLFEARTVLCRDAEEIVREAWNVTELMGLQQQYIRHVQGQMEFLTDRKLSREELEGHATREMDAYVTAMINDPLLPKDLHPHGYLGCDAYKAHLAFVRTMKSRLKG